eukprot:scaffold29671_cov18-Tisochrysis_lutea.AAC.2
MPAGCLARVSCLIKSDTQLIGDANVLICATGASDPRDPLGPFNVSLGLREANNRFTCIIVQVWSAGLEPVVNFSALFLTAQDTKR